MARLPTDRQLLRKIYDRYHDVFVSFDQKVPSRSTKVYVPVDLASIAKSLKVDPELVFGRLYYHLEPKFGEPNGKSEIHFFLLSLPSNSPSPDRHLINFPLLESVLASLEYEHRKFLWATGISILSVAIAISALAVSIVINVLRICAT